MATPATIPPPSPQAFAQAHGALAAWIRRRLTEATGDPHVAEDLAQQTWQAVWEAVSQGRYDPNRAALSTFAYAVSQNVYRHWLRRQSTAAAHAPAILANVSQPSDPENNPLADAELIDELRRVFREGCPGIGEETMRTLHLIARGATDRELALELAVAPSTAHARKQAALQALRAHLNSRFFSERGPSQRQQPEAHIMLTDQRLESLLRDAHAVDAFERGDAVTTMQASATRKPAVQGARRIRWVAIAAAVALLAAAPFVLPRVFAPRPDGRLAHPSNPRLPAVPSIDQPSHGQPNSSLLMAVYQNDAGKLSCVNWSADALKGRTIASLTAEELTRLGLTLACDPGAARILVVGLEGPAAALPTSDARAHAVAQCLSTSPPCASGTFNPQTCASAGCLDHEVTVRIESLALR